MDLTRFVDDLQNRVSIAAAATGDDAAQMARQLTGPLDAAVRLLLLDALSTAAGEISAELAPGSVDLRLRGGEPEFIVVAPAAPAEIRAEPPSSVPSATDADGGTTRTTLRLPEALKIQVEVAAAREGVSVNTWLVRAVATVLEQPVSTGPAPAAPSSGRGTRLTGWVR